MRGKAFAKALTAVWLLTLVAAVCGGGGLDIGSGGRGAVFVAILVVWGAVAERLPPYLKSGSTFEPYSGSLYVD